MVIVFWVALLCYMHVALSKISTHWWPLIRIRDHWWTLTSVRFTSLVCRSFTWCMYICFRPESWIIVFLYAFIFYVTFTFFYFLCFQFTSLPVLGTERYGDYCDRLLLLVGARGVADHFKHMRCRTRFCRQPLVSNVLHISELIYHRVSVIN